MKERAPTAPATKRHGLLLVVHSLPLMALIDRCLPFVSFLRVSGRGFACETAYDKMD